MRSERSVKLDKTLADLIEAKGFSRNRKKLARAVGISTAALTQYLRGQTKPSFDVLIKLAEELEVSLDYLVFGIQTTTPNPIDYGPVTRYMDVALANVQARTDERTWLFARIAHILAEQIDDAAKQVANNHNFRAGLLTDEETMVLEECSNECWITTMNLQYDIIQLDDQTKAPGRFLGIVANNLFRGRSYRFLLPAGIQDWKPLVNGYLSLLQQVCGNDSLVMQNCRFKCTENPVVNGYGLYHLDIPELLLRDKILYEKIRTSISDDDWLGYVIMPSKEPQSDALMDELHLTCARTSFERLWNTGKSV